MIINKLEDVIALMKCLEGGNTSCNDTKNGLIEIVVLQRGWVAVGKFNQVGEECTLNNAYVIRQWGTEKGLGQIAMDGPTSKTKLDKTGTMRFNKMTIVTRIDCNQEKWNAEIS